MLLNGARNLALANTVILACRLLLNSNTAEQHILVHYYHDFKGTNTAHANILSIIISTTL